jgi:4-hydroxy-3-methylbut-2-enyl diphosphate reductase
MTRLLLLAPMHVEVFAVRGCDRVLRTGMGPERARIAAARAQAIEASAVAVAGICGGIAPEVATGDVVCASEVRLEDGTAVGVPAAGAVAAVLRGRGLRVHVGPMLSIDHIAGSAEREALRESGVLALDMESGWLTEAAAGRPFAVVRTVADAAGRHVFHPRFLADASRALATLRKTLPGLAEWAERSPEPAVAGRLAA